MDPFLQEPPRRPHRFTGDRPLRQALERLLPAEVFEEASPELSEMSRRASEEFPPLADWAETHPPRHVPYDAWGRRVDRIEVDEAWLRLVEIGQEKGVVATPFEDRFGEHGRVVQYGLLLLYSPSTATADCPLAMTDACARVLLNEDASLAERYVPRLVARSNAWTSGQWMTEKEGGSDVGRTGTVARDLGDGKWSLHGTKWFTSATTADVSLALARPEGAEEGSRGLSLFLLELRKPDGSWNGITVRRLKDKLGTRALPTAELDLDGTVAVPVGGIGSGVRKISAMLNITRLHAAAGSNGGVGLGLSIARDYAFRREAFGRVLADLPLHRVWIAELTAEYEAMTVLGFRAAGLVGEAEGGGDSLLARVVLPLTKMSICSRGVWTASQLVESFGGMGYLEDTGLPRILRDSQVQSIWEGTTSVMALDVMRALLKESAAEAFIEEVERAVGASSGSLLEGPAARVREALDELKVLIKEPSEAGARRLAWAMASTYQGALLCEAADWALSEKEDPRTAHAAQVFTARQLVGAPPEPSNDELGNLAFGN